MTAHEDCQKARRWLIGLLVGIFIVMGSAMTKLMVDMAVVKEKVTAIEKQLDGQLVPRDNRVARDLTDEGDETCLNE